MTKKEIEKCRKTLLEDKERIELSINKVAKDIEEASMEQRGDEIDEANALSNTALSIRLKERERLLLVKIEQALTRIEEGTYSECESCGDEIGAKRLLIRPVTNLCIKCKEIQEKREGGYRNANF